MVRLSSRPMLQTHNALHTYSGARSTPHKSLRRKLPQKDGMPSGLTKLLKDLKEVIHSITRRQVNARNAVTWVTIKTWLWLSMPISVWLTRKMAAKVFTAPCFIQIPMATRSTNCLTAMMITRLSLPAWTTTRSGCMKPLHLLTFYVAHNGRLRLSVIAVSTEQVWLLCHHCSTQQGNRLKSGGLADAYLIAV